MSLDYIIRAEAQLNAQSQPPQLVMEAGHGDHGGAGPKGPIGSVTGFGDLLSVPMSKPRRGVNPRMSNLRGCC